MWPFDSKVSLAGAGVLQGWTDWHSHILPGVDDGIRHLEESLAVLDWYGEQGVREVWLTPHIMEDIPNRPEDLRACFGRLQAAYRGPVRLHLAAEHMLDPLFRERLESGDLLPYRDGPDGDAAGAVLLVETSYFNPPMDLWGLLEEIRRRGYQPLLAHPERYVYMSMADYRRLAASGVKLQLNLPSLAGAYGEEARRKAFALLRAGLYDRTGSDLHRLSHFQEAVGLRAVPSRLAGALPLARF